MLVLTRKEKERIFIVVQGWMIVLVVLKIDKDRMKLGIDLPPAFPASPLETDAGIAEEVVDLYAPHQLSGQRVFNLYANQKVVITIDYGQVEITVTKIEDRKVGIGVGAPDWVTIDREEIYRTKYPQMPADGQPD